MSDLLPSFSNMDPSIYASDDSSIYSGMDPSVPSSTNSAVLSNTNLTMFSKVLPVELQAQLSDKKHVVGALPPIDGTPMAITRPT